MSIFRRANLVLDAAPVQIGDGVPRLQHLHIPAGEVVTPFWLRLDGGTGSRVLRVNALPFRTTAQFGAIEALSADPDPPFEPVEKSDIVVVESLRSIEAARGPIIETLGLVTASRAAVIEAEGQSGDGGSLIYDQQWDYASSAAMRSAAIGFNSTMSPTPPSLETESASEACPLGKFSRTYYPGNGSEGAVDWDWLLPSGKREIWIEMYMRFGNGWTGTSDDKSFFLYSNSQGARRWELHYGPDNGNYMYCGVGASANEWIVTSSDFNPQRLNKNAYWDNQWHRIRLYCKMNDPSQSNGAIHWTHDNTVLLSDTVGDVWTPTKKGSPVSTSSQSGDTFYSMRLGANADPSGSGIRDWGRIRVWDADPEW